jgi:hypothetical protein
MSNRGRRNKADFTVDKKLTVELTRQVTIDFEKNCHLTWGAFSKLALRPEYVHGPFYNACRHKFNNLKKFKKAKPDDYYKSYGEVVGGQYRDSDNSESENDCFSDAEDDDKEEEEAVAPRTLFKSPGSAKRSSARFDPTSSQKKRNTPSPAAFPFLTPKFSSPNHKMASSIPSSRGSSQRSKASKDEFTSLEDAVDSVGHGNVTLVDFNFPEDNFPPLFMIQKLLQIETPSAREIITEVKVHLNSLVDLRDYKYTKAKVVCGGRALLVTMPKVPFFRRNEVDVKMAHSKEAVKCKITQNSHTSFANVVANDQDRLMLRHLFVFPNEGIVSADLESDDPPKGDQKVKLTMRKVPTKCYVGEEEVQPVQNPGFFLMRLISEEAGVLRDQGEESDDDLQNAFTGMEM